MCRLEQLPADPARDRPRRLQNPVAGSHRQPQSLDRRPQEILCRILLAAQDAGLQRFLYHHQGNLTVGEWTVIVRRDNQSGIPGKVRRYSAEDTWVT
jgi:hypothetical protein